MIEQMEQGLPSSIPKTSSFNTRSHSGKKVKSPHQKTVTIKNAEGISSRRKHAYQSANVESIWENQEGASTLSSSDIDASNRRKEALVQMGDSTVAKKSQDDNLKLDDWTRNANKEVWMLPATGVLQAIVGPSNYASVWD